MRTLLLFTGLAAVASAADFNWKGSVPAGKEIEIKGVNGKIDAEAAMSGQVEVTAVKTGQKSDPNSVTVQVVPHAGGVTICAVYPTPSGKPANECAPGSGGHMNNKDNDVKVDFLVKVPAGVNLRAKTVNGGIKAHDLRGEIHANTVNGGVDISSSEVVEAKTVNGGIVARLGQAHWREPLAFETVNGSVTVRMPAGVNAMVSSSTVNGSLKSDFPITVKGSFGPKHMEGTLGNGGPELKLKTVNGSIHLVKE